MRFLVDWWMHHRRLSIDFSAQMVWRVSNMADLRMFTSSLLMKANGNMAIARYIMLYDILALRLIRRCNCPLRILCSSVPDYIFVWLHAALHTRLLRFREIDVNVSPSGYMLNSGASRTNTRLIRQLSATVGANHESSSSFADM